MLGVNLSDYLGNRCSGSDYIYNSLGNPRVYISIKLYAMFLRENSKIPISHGEIAILPATS